MKPAAAFIRWAASPLRLGTLQAAQTVLDRYRGGDLEAKRWLRSWLAQDGIDPIHLVNVPPADLTPRAVYPKVVCDALVHLHHRQKVPILQIRSARLRDISVQEWFLPAAPPYWPEQRIGMTPELLATLRTLAQHGRASAVDANAALLVWPGEVPWTDAQVRYALTRGAPATTAVGMNEYLDVEHVQRT